MRTQRMREKILQPSRKTHFEKAAHHVLNLTDEQLAQLILQGQFTEVPNE